MPFGNDLTIVSPLTGGRVARKITRPSSRGSSFADYLCRWLAHAAGPHGVSFSVL